MLEGSVLKHEDWMPIVLLPVKAANLETPTWLMRCPLPPRDLCVATAAVEGRSGYLSLDPPAARCKADEFSA
jgi:hypothetical protein